jgi:hypothetical protein
MPVGLAHSELRMFQTIRHEVHILPAHLPIHDLFEG